MTVNWDEIKKVLVPIKDYDDLCRRFRIAFSFPFVRQIFNFSFPGLVDYTQRLLGGDPRGRYDEYVSILVPTMYQIHQAGVDHIQDLAARVDTRDRLVSFFEESQVQALDVVQVLKYLVYWVIPGEKYLSGLIRDNETVLDSIIPLRECGVRTNLEILQQGRSAAGRRELATGSGIPEAVILDLVNRADFSRLPWASKATISNIIGAGYASLAELAGAHPEQLYADFFRYGKSIGKNLKYGNEIENSYRIAKIVPVIVE